MKNAIKMSRPKSKYVRTCAHNKNTGISCMFWACGIIKHDLVSQNSLLGIKLWIYYLNEIKDYMVLYAENIISFLFIISFGFR